MLCAHRVECHLHASVAAQVGNASNAPALAPAVSDNPVGEWIGSLAVANNKLQVKTLREALLA